MKYKLIGIYQLITGIFGVIILLFVAATKIPGRETQIIPSFALGLILYGGIIYAGFSLLKQLKHGRKYSLWVQGLQIVGFTYNGVQYLFTGSAFLSLIISNGLHIQTRLALIDYNIEKVSLLLPFEVKIFIVPVILLLLLLKRKNKGQAYN